MSWYILRLQYRDTVRRDASFRVLAVLLLVCIGLQPCHARYCSGSFIYLAAYNGSIPQKDVALCGIERAIPLWNEGVLGRAVGRPVVYNGAVYVQCALSNISFLCANQLLGLSFLDLAHVTDGPYSRNADPRS